MESEVLKSIVSYGVFAVLFFWLLYYVLKENGKRESKYQDIIIKLTDKFDIIESSLSCACKDIGDIKEKIFK